MTKTKAGKNKIENRTTIGKNETKSWFFENVNKLDKPLAKLTKLKNKEDSNYYT